MKYRETAMGKLKKKKLNEKRYRINEKRIITDYEDDFVDHQDKGFHAYCWFLFKAMMFNPDNPSALYRLYRFLKKIFKKRDSAP